MDATTTSSACIRYPPVPIVDPHIALNSPNANLSHCKTSKTAARPITAVRRLYKRGLFWHSRQL